MWRAFDTSPTHVTNPTLIVEVLSASTAEYDRGEKLQHCQRITSLAEIVLVDYEAKRVELWTRGSADWQRTLHAAGETLELSSVRCRLRVDEVFTAASAA